MRPYVISYTKFDEFYHITVDLDKTSAVILMHKTNGKNPKVEIQCGGMSIMVTDFPDDAAARVFYQKLNAEWGKK